MGALLVLWSRCDMADTILTEKIRNAIRISSKAEPITEEINDCIAAAEKDLRQVGVVNLDEEDALIIRAVTLYCKAEFGYSEQSEKFRKSYDTLKMALSLMEEYNTAKEGAVDNGTVGE